MSIDLAPLLDPARSAVLVFECQENLLADSSPLPGLAAAAREAGLLPRIAELVGRARGCGVPVLYMVPAHRPEGAGSPGNTPIETRVRESGGKRFDAGPVCSAVAPEPGEVVVERPHGLTGFYESGLDPLLRTKGVKTLVLAGISLNLGVFGTAIEAANRGYRVVIPTDCVVGDPPEYGEQMLRYSLRNVAFLGTSIEIADAWEAQSR